MRHKSAILVVLAGLFILTSGCATHTPSIHRSIDQSVRTADVAPKVVADYQPWFGAHNHINVGYSTQDPAVLRKQIQQAKEMGIYAFAADWYGDRQPYIDRSYALLQHVASETGFHVALMYDETEEDTGRATDDALEAMDKAYKQYIGPDAPARQAYLTYNGRPVIFIFPKRGHTNWDQVRAQVNTWESPPILIYKDLPPAQYAKNFDGYYAWVHPGPKGWAADGSEWGQQYLETFYKRMKERFPDKIIVGGVWPGFDDRKASWSLNRRMDRRCGKTFEDTLHIFREHNDPSRPMPFVMIATWNDYEEGTQIENGIAQCKGSQPQSFPGGR
ncbi:MAG TPA: endo-1,3-alpha-glucanase family glycosylhydrolase [Terriglobales bacterium]|nr:endo-1,3-alpha-glucanase family glycosylhydrolase [Terriglobales bacterium]